jgi:hypothetical protein
MLAGGAIGWTQKASALAAKKSQSIHGHTLLSPEQMQNRKDGKHHFHTTDSGHRVHAHLRQGKLAGISVRDSKGAKVPVTKRIVKRPAKRMRADTGATDVVRVGGVVAAEGCGPELAQREDETSTIAQANGGFQVWVCFGFRFNGQMFFFCFPMSSCHPSVGDPPAEPSPQGGDDDPNVDDLDN